MTNDILVSNVKDFFKLLYFPNPSVTSDQILGFLCLLSHQPFQFFHVSDHSICLSGFSFSSYLLKLSIRGFPKYLCFAHSSLRGNLNLQVSTHFSMDNSQIYNPNCSQLSLSLSSHFPSTSPPPQSS